MIPIDKQAHAWACAFATMFVAHAATPLLPPIIAGSNAMIGLVGGLAVGYGKELYDKYVGKTGFSWGDLTADAVGAVAGALAWRLGNVI